MFNGRSMRMLIRDCFVAVLLAMTAGAGIAFAAETSSYQADQAVDEEFGLLDILWDWSRMDWVNIPSRLNQPAQARPGGLPPYDQEVELAQDISSRRTCFNGQGQQIPC